MKRILLLTMAVFISACSTNKSDVNVHLDNDKEVQINSDLIKKEILKGENENR